MSTMGGENWVQKNQPLREPEGKSDAAAGNWPADIPEEYRRYADGYDQMRERREYEGIYALTWLELHKIISEGRVQPLDGYRKYKLGDIEVRKVQYTNVRQQFFPMFAGTHASSGEQHAKRVEIFEAADRRKRVPRAKNIDK